MTRSRLRPELQAIIPDRMRGRPIDRRGYSIPWFVARVDGEYDFRVMDVQKWHRAIAERRCWLCGGSLGKWLTFVIGPMCMINRITSEPPCHMTCAVYAVQGCPFLTLPAAKYRNAKLPEGATSTPGMVLWTTRGYAVRRVADGQLISLDHDPDELSFWTKGRPATRAEVLAAIRVGLPKLREAVDDTLAARAEFRMAILNTLPLLPGEPDSDEEPLLGAVDWQP